MPHFQILAFLFLLFYLFAINLHIYLHLNNIMYRFHAFNLLNILLHNNIHYSLKFLFVHLLFFHFQIYILRFLNFHYIMFLNHLVYRLSILLYIMLQMLINIIHDRFSYYSLKYLYKYLHLTFSTNPLHFFLFLSYILHIH